ncbi:MAG: 1-deoxy-D-xylulose-5-phosphate synthase, partial [Alistipes sp.]|nr:1-deoxy-D-xylulose-5-phosphate synthase [Alistipes sp.]
MSVDKYNLLTQIDSPSDLKRLSISSLPQYCDEVRRYIVECCAENPGHLASSLGAVELAVALHYVYNTPDDRIVWDVGHQAYAHKIITGRRDRFVDIRKYRGISGFLNRKESEFDTFVSGHASVSISAAFGMAKASELKGEQRKVVAVIGDGSMTGGLAFEGLNNAGDGKNCDILVILNDNNMAIDEPTGALGSYLTKVSTSKLYNNFKRGLWRILGHTPFVLRLFRRVGNMVKQGLMKNSNLFESLNFRYFGRIDGNNVKELVRTLTDLRDISGPKLLHVMTLKGKGYAPAEKSPTEWHAPGRFDVSTGARIKSTPKADRYQDVFGQTLLDLARADERVVGITPAMPSGCSMSIMMEQMPERC